MELKKIIVNFVILILIIISFFIIYISFQNYKNLPLYSYFLFFISFSIISLSLFILKFLNLNRKINFLLVVFFSLATLFVINFSLILNDFYNPEPLRDKKQRIKIAEKKGIKFDKRSKLEVIADLTQNNKKAYNAILPSLLNKFAKENKIMPLSGISNSITVYENETGEYLIYMSDRYGFNNNDFIYNKPTVDFLIIGDSFAHGANVKKGQDVASILRKKGFNAITIGMGANGPLAELASLIEYGIDLNPKNILWFYSSNDLKDLVRELQNPILKKYIIRENFKQDLILKQKKIDKILIEFHENKIKDFKKLYKKNQFFSFKYITSKFLSSNNSKKIFTLYQVRVLLKIDKGSFIKENKITNETKEYFKRIFYKACEIIDKNNSQIFLINLPSYHILAKGNTYSDKFTENFINNLFIKKIDFSKYLLEQENFKIFFPFEMPGHFTKEGYEKLTEFILENITYEGFDNCNYNKYNIN